jgi:hypothetical protein
VNCSKCGSDIGGTREVKAKRSRLNQPAAVLIYESTQEKLFSVNTSTRDDRCLVVQEGSTFLCSHQLCKTNRAVFVSSNMPDKFSCAHTKKCKEAVNACGMRVRHIPRNDRELPRRLFY